MSEQNLDDLDFKDFTGFPSLTGFYSKTMPRHLLLALYEYLSKKLSED